MVISLFLLPLFVTKDQTGNARARVIALATKLKVSWLQSPWQAERINLSKHF
jgi:hypothetical protein